LDFEVSGHAGGFTSDGKVVVTAGGGGDGSIRAWNPKTGEATGIIPAGHGSHDESGVTCMAFGADAAVVATGGVDGAVVLSNIATGKSVAKLEQHSDSVEAVAFANGLPLLVSAGMDGEAIIWDTAARASRAVCSHPGGVVALAMQHKGPLFATGCLDGVVRVWDVRDGRCVRELGGHTEAVQCLAWALDDQHLVSAGDDGHAILFALS
jgi:angio-associated migratory cell protein